ncbi:MAG: LytTR family DNA-binding domain-containing protein [Ignavibacteriaceae bacterium]|nr:LytTR family DNA-binding domain-containing protein [Ignavibacteriaceae bacterium]
MKILIADDEKPARKKIISFLKSLALNDELMEAENGIDAVENILNKKPELVFLDIQMPGLTGFDVIREVGIDKMPAVVFVTAYDQYAIDAFEVNAVDYLLKPFDKERFIKSFNRAVEQITLTKSKNESIKNLLKEIVHEKKTVEKLLVNIGARYFFVNSHEIIYISSAEKYVELNTTKGKYLYRETMNNLESALDKNKFARIHRSYIVNVDYIQEMQPWSHGDFVILLKNGEKISMSRRYRDNLFNEKVAE